MVFESQEITGLAGLPLIDGRGVSELQEDPPIVAYTTNDELTNPADQQSSLADTTAHEMESRTPELLPEGKVSMLQVAPPFVVSYAMGSPAA
jgi:hypothetical protein